MNKNSELRAWLEDTYDEPISARRWEGFEKRFAKDLSEIKEDIAAGKEQQGLDRLAYTWRGFSLRGQTGEQPGDESGRSADPRWKSLAEILATRARRDPDVIALRRDLLRDEFIELAEVPAWIRETAKADGEATLFRPDHPTNFPQASSELIRYVSDYYGGHALASPIRIGGSLWWLRGVPRRISHGFGWPERWMVPFVLSDVQPPAPMTLGWTIHESGSDVATMDWIELRVNPYAVSPRELERKYRDLRVNQLGLRRVDAMTEKGAALAVHWERTSHEEPGKSRAEWNKANPRWRYLEASGNYRRDAEAAHAQATGEAVEQ